MYLACVNGIFNSKWKSKVIPGIYDKKYDEQGRGYYEVLTSGQKFYIKEKLRLLNLYRETQ